MSLTFFFAPLIISVISVSLAALISIIDKIVNNYGQVKIDVNNGADTLTVNGGSPLLFTLGEKKIFVPSACGGKGTCAACKVKILKGIDVHMPTETPLLTPEEIQENIHLSCQIKVKSDISIEIPEELFNIKQYETIVESIKDVTYDIKEVYLKLVEPQTINFKAGQYAQFVVPPYEKIKGSTQRAYSMLSTPGDINRLGFLVRLVPGGIATTYVFKHLKEGDKFQVIAPVGDFHLQETEADMLCIAGGSGMAPLHSIICDLAEKNRMNRNIWYFFGARAVRDLFYVDRFRELEKEWSNFHFVPALSEPLPDDNWQGETGLITDVLDKYLKQHIKSDNAREGYLCGSPGMIDACIKVLNNNNVPDDKIFYDKF